MSLKLTTTNMMEERSEGINPNNYLGSSELSIEFLIKLVIINYDDKLIRYNPILKITKIENLLESLKYELWIIEDYLHKNSEPSTLVWYVINTETSTLEDMINMNDFNERNDFIEIESAPRFLENYIGCYTSEGQITKLTRITNNSYRLFVKNNNIGQKIKKALDNFENFAYKIKFLIKETRFDFGDKTE